MQARATFVNGAALALTGHRRRDVIGHPLREVFPIAPCGKNASRRDPIDRALHKGEAAEFADHALRTQDRGKVSVAGYAAPIRDESGDILGVAVVFHETAPSPSE